MTTTSANWNTYDGSNAWGSAGAMNTTSDRYDTDLWDATASTFGATGNVTIPLNASGVSVVQGWVNATLSNYGLTVQYMGTGTTSDYWKVASRETSIVSIRPKLNITYTASTDPTITISGTLTPFSAQPGVPSTAQTYSVAGSNLTDNISITAPTGFELSTNGTTYLSGLTLNQTGGTVSSTTVYVRLNSATEGSFGGNITHISSGASTKNVAVSGNVLYINALRFGSSNAYVTFGDAAALKLATFTLETWFRREGAGVTASTGSGGVTTAIPLVTKGGSGS